MWLKLSFYLNIKILCAKMFRVTCALIIIKTWKHFFKFLKFDIQYCGCVARISRTVYQKKNVFSFLSTRDQFHQHFACNLNTCRSQKLKKCSKVVISLLCNLGIWALKSLRLNVWWNWPMAWRLNHSSNIATIFSLSFSFSFFAL